MRSKEHLGNREEVMDFAYEMYRQLELHNDEKTPLRPVEFDIVKNIVVDEVLKRIRLIKDGDSRTMEKQCVHIANYVMMLWLKTKK